MKNWNELTDEEKTACIGLYPKEVKASEWNVRREYYRQNPNDKDAKTDDDKYVRTEYYRRNPNDLDAKTDEDEYIRKEYEMRQEVQKTA